MIEFGIESGSERILRLIKKNITLAQVRGATRLVQKHRMDWKAFFMVGFPEETKEDIEQTKQLIRELDPRGVVLSTFTPYPGNELYDTAAKLGLMPSDPDWSRFSHQSPENCFVSNISREEFQRIVTDLARLVDRHNHSPGKAFRYFRTRLSLYVRHPSVFLRKAISYGGSRVG
jgi:anaerobic magnesium-protoporphyrin IX monomethyl ester cyclase